MAHTRVGRGQLRRKITITSGKLHTSLESEYSDPVVVDRLLKTLEAEYAAFEEYHLALHSTFSDGDAVASEAYFTNIKSEYEELVVECQAWLLSHPVDASRSSETESAELTLEAFAKKTDDRLDTLFEKLNKLDQLDELLQSRIPERVAETASASTPYRTAPRVSFGGVSRVEVSERDDSEVQDVATAAVQALSRSLAELAQSNKDRQERSYKVPKFKLFKFSGKKIDYWPFMRAFDTQVVPHESDPSVLLGILIDHTPEEVSSTLQVCPLRDSPAAAYKRAREILEERFGRLEDVAQAWLDQFHLVKPVRTVESLLDLTNLLTKCHETLRAVSQLPEFETKSNLAMIINKLPRVYRDRWQQWVYDLMEQKSKKATLVDVLNFCTRLYREKSDPVYGGPLEPQSDKKIPPKKAYSTNEAPAEKPAEVAMTSPTVSVNYGRDRPDKKRKESRTSATCTLCNGDHMLHRCDKFLNLDPESRHRVVRDKVVCLNCFSPKHLVRECNSPHTCKQCNAKHHTLLHRKAKSSEQSSGPSVGYEAPETSAALGPSGGSEYSSAAAEIGKVALPVVPVRAINPVSGEVVVIYALIDSGSTCTLCTDSLIDKLKLRFDMYRTSFSTISDDRVTSVCRKTSFRVSDLAGNNPQLLPRVLGRRTLNLSLSCRATMEDIKKWSHLKDLNLPSAQADQIDLLIGMDNPQFFVRDEKIPGVGRQPFAVKSLLGWYVGGPVNRDVGFEVSCGFVEHPLDVARAFPDEPVLWTEEEKDHQEKESFKELNKKFDRFWRMDDVSSITDRPKLSENDKRVLELWERCLVHDGERFSLPIPFKRQPPGLLNNKQFVLWRLKSLGRRFLRQSKLLGQYTKNMHGYVDKNHSELVDEDDEVEEGLENYLAHHPVFHPRKPEKPRSVFDCSAKWKGLSLNDFIHAGPDLMNRLLDVLLQIRIHRFMVGGDVEGMFSQILVYLKQRNALRYFWWKNDDPREEPVTYRMKTHLFGGIWSPSAVNFTLKKTADIFGKEYSEKAVEMVKERFYVDDGMDGTAHEAEGVQLLMDVRDMLSRGGFNFCKFFASSESIMKELPPEALVKNVAEFFDEENMEFLLGCGYKPHHDSWAFKPDLPCREDSKRGVLSTVCAIYDPMGLIAPVVVQAKSIFQECCRRKLDWDDSLPEDLRDTWHSWKRTYHEVSNILIDRCVISKKIHAAMRDVSCELHVYSDAADVAYGSACYLRALQEEKPVSTHLLLAKGRLAPLKTVTIPRLELCGAHMSAQLAEYVKDTLGITLCRIVYWVDSSIVLYYIYNDDGRYPTFVATRVGTIRRVAEADQWRHVPTDLNPADLISRGCTADVLVGNTFWFNGPAYLMLPEDQWPENIVKKHGPDPPEYVQTFTTEFVASTKFDKKSVKDPASEKLIRSCSSWYKLQLRLLAIKKFVAWRASKKTVLDKKFTMEELRAAERSIVIYLQRVFTRHSNVGAQKQYAMLFPKMQDGVLRVGGRLGQSNLHPDARHPIVLADSYLVRLLVWRAHIESGHSGVERTLHELLKKFWVISARKVIRSVKNTCFRCRVREAPLRAPLMSELPKSRVEGEVPPFWCSGLDYFGPLLIKQGRVVHKRYGCLFTCMQTRAVHVEVAHTLDTSSCIDAVTRLSARRGRPAEIQSDNGTNLVGARRELKECLERWNQGQLESHFAQKGIKWSFNTPAASHMGGVWERQVRSIRSILMKLVERRRLTDESLRTFLCVAEDIVNSRPITAVSTDPDDLAALTPNHLLRPDTGVNLPLGRFEEADTYRRRWAIAQYLGDIFWQRWRSEYLPGLQRRTKWYTEQGNLKTGDLVILQEDGLPRNYWPLGRVVETYPDEEGTVRSVEVKTARGFYRRPVHKMCLLEAAL